MIRHGMDIVNRDLTFFLRDRIKQNDRAVALEALAYAAIFPGVSNRGNQCPSRENAPGHPPRPLLF